jgi:hypothetical protein
MSNPTKIVTFNKMGQKMPHAKFPLAFFAKKGNFSWTPKEFLFGIYFFPVFT